MNAGKPRAWWLAGLLVVLGFAAYSRAVGVMHGLPLFLEEAWPLREAFEMWGWGGAGVDLNPHRFHYPSLTFYLHFLLQQAQFFFGRLAGTYANPADFWLSYHTDPTAVVIAARVMAMAADLVAIGCVAWTGERIKAGAGFGAALFLAIAPTMIDGTRAIVPDTYVAMFGALALALIVAWHEQGGNRLLAGAVVAIGLAAGAKYPGATLLLPLGIVLWLREGSRGLARWPLLAAGAAGVFFLTTPYALLDFGTFIRDLGFVRALPAAGHLGRLEGSGFAFQVANLEHNVGWVGIALLLGSLVATASALRKRSGEVLIWSALLALAVPVLLARVEANRYLIPALPFVVLAVSSAIARVGELARARWSTHGGFVTTFLGLGVLIMRSGFGFPDPGVSTQTIAAEWFATNVGPEALVVQEAYGAPLHTRLAALELRSNPLFAEASERVRARAAARVMHRSVTLPLLTVGPGTVAAHGPLGERDVHLAPHAADLSMLSYDPRLFAHADYIVTTSAVRNRFLLDPERFAAAVALYRFLDTHADIASNVEPMRGQIGPEITVYRMTSAARDSLLAFGPLDPLWWLGVVPAAARRDIEAALVPEPLRTDGAERLPGGAPAPWIRTLDRMAATLVRPFAHPMSVYLEELGAHDAARRFAAATLAAIPDDVPASLVFATASGSLGDWRAARGMLETTRAALAEGGVRSAAIEREIADVDARAGAPAR